MHNAVVGVIVGLVLGVVVGASVVAPRLKPSPQSNASNGTDASIGGSLSRGKVTLPSASPKVPVYRFKMASAYGSSLPQLGALAKRLESGIWRVSDGAIEISFHEPGALVAPKDMFDAVASGTIDAAFASPGLWANKAPSLQLFASTPFGPGPGEYLAWMYAGGGLALYRDIYRKYGLYGLPCGLTAPGAGAWFRTPVTDIESLKGRTMAMSGLGAKVMKKLGVKTLSMEPGDMFAALESGKLDALEYSLPAIDLKLGFFEKVGNYYFPGWHRPTVFYDLIVNLKKWKVLPPNRKAQIEAVCGDNIRNGLSEGGAQQFPALRTLAEKGVAIRRLPNDVLDALRAAWKDVARSEAAADADFRRVWRSLSAFREDYAIWMELGRY